MPVLIMTVLFLEDNRYHTQVVQNVAMIYMSQKIPILQYDISLTYQLNQDYSECLGIADIAEVLQSYATVRHTESDCVFDIQQSTEWKKF